VKVLGVCGSLRAASINAALLRAMARLAQPDVHFQIFAGVGDLALFNPDLETSVPAPVSRWRGAVAASDALVFASPEYAHGVTGSIKNALDWLVSFEPFVNKRVAVLNAAPRAFHADAALRETLRTMSAVIVEAASVTIPALGSGLTEQGMIEDPTIASAIRTSLIALCDAFAEPRSTWLQLR
jgi:chromate reductase